MARAWSLVRRWWIWWCWARLRWWRWERRRWERRLWERRLWVRRRWRRLWQFLRVQGRAGLAKHFAPALASARLWAAASRWMFGSEWQTSRSVRRCRAVWWVSAQRAQWGRANSRRADSWAESGSSAWERGFPRAVRAAWRRLRLRATGSSRFQRGNSERDFAVPAWSARRLVRVRSRRAALGEVFPKRARVARSRWRWSASTELRRPARWLRTEWAWSPRRESRWAGAFGLPAIRARARLTRRRTPA